MAESDWPSKVATPPRDRRGVARHCLLVLVQSSLEMVVESISQTDDQLEGKDGDLM